MSSDVTKYLITNPTPRVRFENQTEEIQKHTVINIQ